MKKSVLPVIALPVIKERTVELPVPGSSRPTNKSVPATDITTILSKVEKNGVKFTQNQINEILSLGIQNNTDVLYEIICDCFSFYIPNVDSSTTIDIYLAMLKNYLGETKNSSEIIFNSITFADQKSQYDDDNNRLRRDIIVRTGAKCPYCDSTNTIVVDAVLRRGDEGSSAILKCFNCNRISKS